MPTSGNLSTARASGRARTAATSLVLVLVAGTIVSLSPARIAGPTVPAFLPAIYSSALLAYVLTSFLFANQFVATRSPGFAILSIAYAFAFVESVPYLLGYPGVFAPNGLIGVGDSSTAWLYDFSNGGFLALLLLYAFVEMRAETIGRTAFRADGLVAIAALVTIVFALLSISAALHGLLPLSATGGHPNELSTRALFPVLQTLALTTTLTLFWRMRSGRVIPLWMTVVAAAISLELFLGNAGGSRYSVGWYLSRIEVTVASGVMLTVFLYYINTALLTQTNTVRMLAAARDDAERAAAANAALLRDYEREQRVAQSFQKAALPASLPDIPGIRFDGFYEPGKSEAQIGGDWFDALRLPDGRVVISIGDVAGSGLDAAVIMANMRQAIRGIAQVHTDPAMILEAADRVLRAEHPERFVTAFVALYDPMYRALTYASAGHNRPLLREPDGAIGELAGQGLPLGLRIRGDAVHVARTIAPGSLLVFYTDGLIESTHDAEEGERLLYAALNDATLAHVDSPARHIHEAVLAGGSRDDVAILTMYVEARAEAANRDGDAVGRWSFSTSDARAASTARNEMLAILSRHGARLEECTAAEVIFSELVGNAVRYAPGAVEVLLDHTTPVPVLHVLDEGAGFSRFPELPRNLFSESGRGLYIISTLAEVFTVARRPLVGSHARVVLAIHSARRPASAVTARGA